MRRFPRVPSWMLIFIVTMAVCLLVAVPDGRAQQLPDDETSATDEQPAGDADDNAPPTVDDHPTVTPDGQPEATDDELTPEPERDDSDASVREAENSDADTDGGRDESDETDFEPESLSEDADAPEHAGDDEWEAVYEAADCPALFGGEDMHATNAHRRENVLGRVRGQRRIVTVIHHARWQAEPVRLRILGIELEDIERDEDSGKWLALVDLADTVAKAYQCHPGLYQIRQDDNLFPNVRVLVVKRGFVLTESYGRLAYIPVAGFTELTFRMIWQSEWTILRPKEDVKSNSRRKRSKKKRNRSKRRRRR